MGRKRAREGLVSLVYNNTFTDGLNAESIEFFLNNFEYVDDEQLYIKNGFKTLSEHIETIDNTIENSLKNWSLERLFRLDLSILRVAVFEILYEESVPNEVAINEAVEIAKKYGTKDSSKLINGILGTIIRSE